MEDRLTAKESSTATSVLMFGWLLTTMFMWWFALYRAPEATPEWLLRAQAVCFGSTENGLPDTYGWAVLVLAPGSFLLALLVAMGRELRQAVSAVTSSTIGVLALSTVLLLASVQVVWAAQRIQEGLEISNTSFEPIDNESLPDNYPMTSEPAPELALIGQHGEVVSLESLKGKPFILSFAFAHCKTICPAIVSSTRVALGQLGGEKASLVIVTLDPWRDTPSALPSLAKKWNFGEGSFVLSGEVEQVNEVLGSYKVPALRDEKTGDINHPALVYVVGPEGNIRYAFNNPSPTWLVEAVRRTAQVDS